MSEQPHDALSELRALHPAVAAAGSVCEALRAAAERAGYVLAVEPAAAQGLGLLGATVRAEGRTAYATLLREGGGDGEGEHEGGGGGGGGRVLAVDCWDYRACAATGSTRDPAEAADVLRAWVQGAGADELTARWPFLRTRDLAAADLRGEREAVARRWQGRLQGPARGMAGEWRRLAVAAHAEPRLRVLSPGRAMYWFTLSRRATPPVSQDLPQTRPLGRGRYEVTHADGRVRTVEGAAAAVAVILEGLPGDLR
ncbi:DUF6193 family natural product biosynthesis protein [Kitasatospora sp. NPDC056076]|uniref:DUF6193 family natural product biosynthesis protein n=1 Tax=Kitasatospora sp. NPDC056076 TaxID=3345703 RepID=UPI0035D69E21